MPGSKKPMSASPRAHAARGAQLVMLQQFLRPALMYQLGGASKQLRGRFLCASTAVAKAFAPFLANSKA